MDNSVASLSTDKRFQLFYSDTFELPLPPNHKFPMAKYRMLRDRIAHSALRQMCELCEAPAAADSALTLAHTPEYVRRVATGELSAVEIRRIGFPWSREMVERARRSVGATIAAAESAWNDGFSANLAGGTHHAFAESGQGYCVFNDTCVGTRWLQYRRLAERIAIVDLDVHQGNGTAAMMGGDPSVYTLSIHCDVNYPFRKSESRLDIALAAGTTDGNYLAIVRAALDQMQGEFQPHFAFYVSGADPFHGDRFGKLKLTKSGLAERDRIVFEFFAERGIPVAVSMAGGYARDISDVVDIHFATIRTGLEVGLRWAPKIHNAQPGR